MTKNAARRTSNRSSLSLSEKGRAARKCFTLSQRPGHQPRTIKGKSGYGEHHTGEQHTGERHAGERHAGERHAGERHAGEQGIGRYSADRDSVDEHYMTRNSVEGCYSSRDGYYTSETQFCSGDNSRQLNIGR